MTEIVLPESWEWMLRKKDAAHAARTTQQTQYGRPLRKFGWACKCGTVAERVYSSRREAWEVAKLHELWCVGS